MEKLKFSDKQLVEDLGMELRAQAEEGILNECLYAAFDYEELCHLIEALEWARKKLGYED